MERRSPHCTVAGTCMRACCCRRVDGTGAARMRQAAPRAACRSTRGVSCRRRRRCAWRLRGGGPAPCPCGGTTWRSSLSISWSIAAYRSSCDCSTKMSLPLTCSVTSAFCRRSFSLQLLDRQQDVDVDDLVEVPRDAVQLGEHVLAQRGRDFEVVTADRQIHRRHPFRGCGRSTGLQAAGVEAVRSKAGCDPVCAGSRSPTTAVAVASVGCSACIAARRSQAATARCHNSRRLRRMRRWTPASSVTVRSVAGAALPRWTSSRADPSRLRRAIHARREALEFAC